MKSVCVLTVQLCDNHDSENDSSLDIPRLIIKQYEICVRVDCTTNTVLACKFKN